jgi:hypothetical protein
MKFVSAALGAALLLVACASPKPASSTDTAATAPASTQTVAPAPNRTVPAPDCPHDGKWALCSIERRLKQSGYVVKRVEQDTIRRAGFSVKPTVYTLGRSRVEIFLYRDSASMARDVAKLDTLSVGPAGKPGQWGDVPPTLIRSANIAAVILSESAVQTERIMLALTAGPPQPGSPR